MKVAQSLGIKVFADGADLADIRALATDPFIAGFTTNPSLMRKAGVPHYEKFARAVVELIGDRPVSFEVFSDNEDEMGRQARLIASWGVNVYVKVPVTFTDGMRTDKLIRCLTEAGVKLNVTALTTVRQVAWVTEALAGTAGAIVSVFAGRIADSGRDPVPIIAAARQIVELKSGVELLWASPRELLNVVQANSAGCHIITVTRTLLEKLTLLGRDLDEVSLDTVRMFHDDAEQAGFHL